MSVSGGFEINGTCSNSTKQPYAIAMKDGPRDPVKSASV